MIVKVLLIATTLNTWIKFGSHRVQNKMHRIF